MGGKMRNMEMHCRRRGRKSGEGTFPHFNFPVVHRWETGGNITEVSKETAACLKTVENVTHVLPSGISCYPWKCCVSPAANIPTAGRDREAGE